MAKKVSINLLISNEMSSRGEHDIIRFPQRVRNYLSLSKDTLILGKGSFELEVEIKRSFRADMLRLGNLRRKDALSEVVALTTGFVTRSTYQRLAARGTKEQSVWISEDNASITIGCDPEFGLVGGQGLLVRGDLAFPGSKWRAFGADGPGMEVRPEPSRNHLALVDHIKAILDTAPERAHEYQWIGGASYQDSKRIYWFGGHIHLGRPKSVPVDRAENCFRALAKVLDHHLSLPLLPFDTPNPHFRRNGCNLHYGSASEIRVKDGGSRFEYRTPSGLWVTHPTLARVVLGVAKAVSEDFYYRAADMNYSSEFLQSGFQETCGGKGFNLKEMKLVTDTINQAKAEALDPGMMEYWLGLMNSLSTREEYEEEIGALIKLVEHSPEKVLPEISVHLNENWQGGRPFLLKPPEDLKQAINAVENKT